MEQPFGNPGSGTTGDGNPLDIEGVFNGMMQVVEGTVVPSLVISMVPQLLVHIAGLLTVFAILIPMAGLAFLGPDPDPEAVLAWLTANIGIAALVMSGLALLKVVVDAVAHAALTVAYVGQQRGETATLSECVGAAFKRFGALLVLTLVLDIAYVVGFFACCVGALVPMILFSVAMPVLLTEGCGPLEALSRSIALTKPHWLSILALLALVFFAGLFIFCVVGFLPFVGAFAGFVVGMVQVVVVSALGAVMYERLNAQSET